MPVRTEQQEYTAMCLFKDIYDKSLAIESTGSTQQNMNALGLILNLILRSPNKELGYSENAEKMSKSSRGIDTVKPTGMAYGTAVYGASTSEISLMLRYLPQQDMSSLRTFSQSEWTNLLLFFSDFGLIVLQINDSVVASFQSDPSIVLPR
ncbi:MAG: hypothetical protein EZS28_056507 [Streblomastix strix]|uniref:Uncharacterized protein n=1 Tax=Streblomastix strix TaxID=222440 RepID=A0A5J4PJH2_9EUKA|nr:MAG: hypothetical protein EZS28_056507 [Streblomastix strix]